MNYNHDIAHCSGYLCLLSDQCRRYYLFREWEQRKLPAAPFTGACYDLETKTCPCFLPMTDEEYQNVEMKKKKIVITLSRVFPTELKSLKPYRK